MLPTGPDLREGASRDWRLLFEGARSLIARGRHSEASDVLRMLALAKPGEIEIWDTLAACHDAEEQSDVAEVLRSLGRLLQTKPQPERRSS